MKMPSPEIKIAFIGTQGSGKSTLVKALLGSDVAGAGNTRKDFRVVLKSDVASSSGDEEAQESKTAITAISSNLVDVVVNDVFFDAHTDASLVLADFPGVLDAECDFRRKIQPELESFNCTVFVLDVSKDCFGLQLDLLHKFHEFTTSRKDMSTIFVCNKVDLNKEVVPNFEKLRRLVKTFFMKDLIPFLAGYAYIYRSFTRLPVDERSYHVNLWQTYESIGNGVFGYSHWNNVTRSFAYLSDVSACIESDIVYFKYPASNFPIFLEALNRCVGECKEQMLIEAKEMLQEAKTASNVQ